MIRVRDARKAELHNILKLNGIAIEAKIKDFLQEDIYERNIVVVKIIAETNYKNRHYEFISEKTYPKKIKDYKIGDMVKVYVDKNDLSRYSFVMNDVK